MVEVNQENQKIQNERIDDKVLKNDTVLSFEEVVDNYVENQSETAEGIDPEAGEAGRKQYIAIIKDEVFLSALKEIAALGLDSDGNGVVDDEDIDDTLLGIEESSPTILDLLIGRAFAETISEKKIKHAKETIDLMKKDQSIDYEKSKQYAEALFNIDELREEDKPIMYAFTRCMALTLNDYYNARGSTEPSIDEVLRALGNFMEIMYGWPTQKNNEKQMDSYSEGPKDEHPTSDTKALAQFFVDIMYKMMDESGGKGDVFHKFVVKLWNILGLVDNQELMKLIKVAMNIDGERDKLGLNDDNGFSDAKDKIIDTMPDNDLKFDNDKVKNKDDVKQILARCRYVLRPEDQEIFQSIFINGKFDEQNFERIGSMQMSVSSKDIIENKNWMEKVKDKVKDEIKDEIKDVIPIPLPEGSDEQTGDTVADLFAILGLNADNLQDAYDKSGVREAMEKKEYYIAGFTVGDVADYMWKNKDDKSQVRQVFTEYAEKVQAGIDQAKKVETTEESENLFNFMSAVALMASDNLNADGLPFIKILGMFGGGAVAINDFNSAKARFETWEKSDKKSIQSFGMNLLDYSLHNVNLLPYITWMKNVNGVAEVPWITQKISKLAQLSRFVISPGFGYATTGMEVADVTKVVGWKILIADVVLDIRINDKTGKISLGIPSFGLFEEHIRNWSEDAKEALIGILHLWVGYRQAGRDLVNVLGWLRGLKSTEQPGGDLIKDFELNRGTYESSGDKIKPNGDKLSPDAMRSSIQGIGPVEKLNYPITHEGEVFTHRVVISQCIQYNNESGTKIIVRVLNKESGSYFDMTYILDHENVKVGEPSIGKVQKIGKIREKVGRLRGKENTFFEEFQKEYNALRKNVTSGEGNAVKKNVDIPGIEDKVTITSEAINATPPETGTIGRKYMIERRGPRGNYKIYIENLDSGDTRLSLVKGFDTKTAVFTIRDKIIDNFHLLDDLKALDPGTPYVRDCELSSFDPEFFRDTNSLFPRELDRFVERIERTMPQRIDGDFDFYTEFTEKTNRAVERVKELNDRGKAKKVLDSFGNGHETAVLVEDIDFTELQEKYTSFSDVVTESQPRSYNKEMFNERVALVRNLQDGSAEITVRLLQDRSQLKGHWKERLKERWLGEKYCDIKYIVKNGQMVGDLSVGEWTPVKRLNVKSTSVWLQDYQLTSEHIRTRIHAERLRELRPPATTNITIGFGEFEYSGEMELNGKNTKFKLISDVQIDGKRLFEISIEMNGKNMVVYRNTNLLEGTVRDILESVKYTDTGIIDGGLYADDGRPLVLTSVDGVAEYERYHALNDLVRNAEARNSGALRALRDFTPDGVVDDWRNVTFKSDRLGRAQNPTVDMLNNELYDIQPKITKAVQLKYPLAMDSGTFTHAAFMKFEGIVISYDGQDSVVDLQQDIYFDLERNVVRRSISFVVDGEGVERVSILPTENARALMQDYSYLAEHVGADSSMTYELDGMMNKWEVEVKSGKRKTTLTDWMEYKKEVLQKGINKAQERVKGTYERLPQWLKDLIKKDKGQCDPMELIKGIIDFFVGRPANALYGPDTAAGKFLNKLYTDASYRQEFFRKMKVNIAEGLKPKMNALEGFGAIMFVVFAISTGVSRQASANADEAGKAAAPSMVGYGVGMSAGIAIDPLLASLKFVKSAPGVWGKVLVIAGGFVAGITTGMWAHDALGVPLEKKHPMFAHYVGAGGEILFSGGTVADLLTMQVTNNTDDIYTWMNESVPGISFNLKDPKKRWIDLDNFRWHAAIDKDWTVAWNKEIDSAVLNRQARLKILRENLEAWGNDPFLKMQSPHGDEMYKKRMADIYDEMEQLEAKKITNESKWRDDQLIELIDGKDMLDEGRLTAKAELRMATLPTRAIDYIHKFGEEHLPKELYDKIIKFENEIMPKAMRDGEADVLETLSKKLYNYRVMATAFLVPYVNAIEFYKGGFGGAELYGREKEEASKFDTDALVNAEAVFLEQPADEPYFSKEKGLESSIMDTPGAKELERISKMTADNGKPGLSQSVANYIRMQDTLASRAVTLKAYELLPDNWEEKAEKLRRDKQIKELPKELQELIAMLEELDQATDDDINL